MSLTPNPPAILPIIAPAIIPPPATAAFFNSCCEEILPTSASKISGAIMTANDITGATRLATTSAVTFFPK